MSFNVPVCVPGTPSPTCVYELLTITVTAPPVANNDIATTLQGVPVTLNTLANDAAGNVGGLLVPSSVTIVPGTAPNPVTQGSLSINPVTGEITFTPVSSFLGVVTYFYNVCDNSVPAMCAMAMQKVTVIPITAPNTTNAADD